MMDRCSRTSDLHGPHVTSDLPGYQDSDDVSGKLPAEFTECDNSTVSTATSMSHISLLTLLSYLVLVFTARRYYSAVFAVALHVSVRFSVRPSQVGVPSKITQSTCI